MEWIRTHLSYANVMATIAVFLALGGSGYAALNGKDKKKVKAIADQEIAAQAPGLSVAKAGSAADATNAVNAVNAANAANADTLDGLDSIDIGLGFLSGRVNNLPTTGTTITGAPSGVSTALTTATLADQNMTLSPNRTILMRDLSVTLSQPAVCGVGTCGAGENVTARLEAFAPGSASVTALISCPVLTTASICTVSGPSATVPARSSLRLSFATSGDAQLAGTTTDALFSWRASAP